VYPPVPSRFSNPREANKISEQIRARIGKTYARRQRIVRIQKEKAEKERIVPAESSPQRLERIRDAERGKAPKKRDINRSVVPPRRSRSRGTGDDDTIAGGVFLRVVDESVGIARFRSGKAPSYVSIFTSTRESARINPRTTRAPSFIHPAKRDARQ